MLKFVMMRLHCRQNDTPSSTAGCCTFHPRTATASEAIVFSRAERALWGLGNLNEKDEDPQSSNSMTAASLAAATFYTRQWR